MIPRLISSVTAPPVSNMSDDPGVAADQRIVAQFRRRMAMRWAAQAAHLIRAVIPTAHVVVVDRAPNGRLWLVSMRDADGHLVWFDTAGYGIDGPAAGPIWTEIEDFVTVACIEGATHTRMRDMLTTADHGVDGGYFPGLDAHAPEQGLFNVDLCSFVIDDEIAKAAALADLAGDALLAAVHQEITELRRTLTDTERERGTAWAALQEAARDGVAVRNATIETLYATVFHDEDLSVLDNLMQAAGWLWRCDTTRAGRYCGFVNPVSRDACESCGNHRPWVPGGDPLPVPLILIDPEPLRAWLATVNDFVDDEWEPTAENVGELVQALSDDDSAQARAGWISPRVRQMFATTVRGGAVIFGADIDGGGRISSIPQYDRDLLDSKDRTGLDAADEALRYVAELLNQAYPHRRPM